MPFFIRILFILFLLGSKISAQCPPAITPTLTITGLYTSNIYASGGSIIYITPSATVTGNIKLENASLYNCGVILSPKISIKQTTSNNQYVLENNNLILSDTISLDSLGHIHNNDTLICKELILKNNSVVDNHYFIDAHNLLVSQASLLSSEALIKASYFQLKDINSQYYSLYGSVSAKKMFRVGVGSIVQGIVFICADSSFINNGLINNSSALTWFPSIRTVGLSQNTGTIINIDFCDLSSSNGGMLDLNTGSLSGLTFCTSQQYFCDFTYTSIKKNAILKNSVLIYPNQVIDKLNIEMGNNNLRETKINILNALGQTVYSLNSPNQKQEIDLSFLSTGIYYLKVHNNSEYKTFEIIKQ